MLATVASPDMEGRVPGSQGIEKAAAYIQSHLEDLNLRPAFTDEDGNASFRQPMQMGTHTTATSVALRFNTSDYTSFDEVSPLAFSGSETVTAPVVFAGYGIVSGPDHYLGFETNETVEDKIAIVLNYEPHERRRHLQVATRAGRTTPASPTRSPPSTDAAPPVSSSSRPPAQRTSASMSSRPSSPPPRRRCAPATAQAPNTTSPSSTPPPPSSSPSSPTSAPTTTSPRSSPRPTRPASSSRWAPTRSPSMSSSTASPA
ncbi:MAG: hypothetical protein R3B67_02430 [Phycisphaerales bacterium]